MESIVNPGAVVVDGPGFVGADSRSLMPDFRNTLSVADLVDLVAYLAARRAQSPHTHDHAHDH